MDLTQMRARLRKDLHDEDSANYRWTDGELDRHVQRTVRDFSLALPLEAQATLTTLIDAAPASVENVNVYHTKLHTIDASSSTVPARFEDVIAAGAGGYAAAEWASFATNRGNVGGQD